MLKEATLAYVLSGIVARIRALGRTTFLACNFSQPMVPVRFFSASLELVATSSKTNSRSRAMSCSVSNGWCWPPLQPVDVQQGTARVVPLVGSRGQLRRSQAASRRQRHSRLVEHALPMWRDTALLGSTSPAWHTVGSRNSPALQRRAHIPRRSSSAGPAGTGDTQV